MLISCNNDDNSDSISSCDFETIIDGDLYIMASESSYDVTNAIVTADCLEITIGSSGCDGETWEVLLVSDYPLAFGDNFGASLSLKLTSNEDCEAYLIRTYSFDLSVIHNNNQDGVISLDGWDETLNVSN